MNDKIKVAVLAHVDDFKIYATGPCTITIVDLLNDMDEVDREPDKILTEEELAVEIAKLHAEQETDSEYAPDDLYGVELSSDDVMRLFRKRGEDPHIVRNEDHCGDDTVDYFDKHVALNRHTEDPEILQTTAMGWMLFRNTAEQEAYEAAHDDPYGRDARLTLTKKAKG